MFIDIRWVEQMVGVHQDYRDKKSYDVEHRAHDFICYTLEQLFHLYAENRTEHLRALELAVIANIFSFMTSLTTPKMNFFTLPNLYEVYTPQPPALRALLDECGIDETGTFLRHR